MQTFNLAGMLDAGLDRHISRIPEIRKVSLKHVDKILQEMDETILLPCQDG